MTQKAMSFEKVSVIIGNYMNVMRAVQIPKSFKVTAEQYQRLAEANRDLRLERTATGELIIMPPTGGDTGKRNIDLSFQVQAWNRQTKLGVAFDSSTAFQLPKGGNLSPDVSWVSRERWDNLTPEERETFPPLCPDFVLESRSKTDSMNALQEKMQVYLENGIRLGWLIDPKNRVVEIYRPQQAVEVYNNPTELLGEDVLPGFVLELEPIFS